MIVDVNQEITEELAAAIQAAGIERVKIRSVLTCESKRGVCRCATAATWRPAGWSSAAKRSASSRRSPSASPARSSPCVRSTSAARRPAFREQSTQDAKSDGFAKFIGIKTVRNKGGELIAMNRNGIIAVVDDKGREKERYQVVYGATLARRRRAAVNANQILLEWDPYTFSILTEVSGTFHFKDLQRRRHHAGAGGRSHRHVAVGGDRFARREAAAADRDSDDRAQGRRQEVPHADPRSLDGARRRRGPRRRRAGEDPARNHQDQGHHRRSAARGRAVRSAQAARDGHHRRDQRHREVRRNHQGPAQDLRRRRRRRAARVLAAARRSHQRAGRRARQGRRSADGRPAQSARHSGRARREGTAEVPGQRDPGSLPAAGRQHQRQAPGSRSPAR